MDFDKENIMQIEFKKEYSNEHHIDMIALYNKNKISETEVRELIKRDIQTSNVLVITKKQFENVFFKMEGKNES